MSIGEVLGRARREAGLTIADVSRHTRIRETIIGDIERDDYSSCGGDFYARGHIRAIARAVGTDSEPLIEEYDAAYQPPDILTDGHWASGTITEEDPGDPPDPVGGQDVAHPRDTPLLPESPHPPATPRAPVPPRAPASMDDPAGTGFPATPHGHASYAPGTPHARATPYPPVTPHAPATPHSGATADGPATTDGPARTDRPATPHGPPGYAPTTPYAPPQRPRRRINWTAVLAVALLVAAGFGGYLLASGGHSAKETSAAGSHRTSGPSAHPTPSTSRAAPAPTHPPAPPQILSPANITAFGPDGTGQGDNPQLARFALDDNAATPWHSDWYTTAHFGNLQPGTGLLLDMGRTVTVQAAQIAVGSVTGGDIELRIGSTPALSDLRPAAHSTDAGGRVRLNPTVPAHGRYVLVWFTKLPHDQAGTFQASVYGIRVQGHM